MNPSWIQEAIRAFHAGALERVDQLCNQALAANPGEVEAHHLMALAAFRRGNLHAAEAGLQRAAALAPGHPEVRNNLGMVYRQQGRFAEASVHFEAARQLRPGYVDALNNLGDAWRRTGRLDAGAAVLAEALALAPDSLAVLNNLALARRDQKRYGEAVELLERARALQPGNWETACNHAYALRDLGRLDAAAERLAELIASAPPGVAPNPLRHALGEILRTLGRYDEAQSCFAAILAEEPWNEGARFAVEALREALLERVPATVVRDLFDGFAAGFDHVLVDKLDYRTPDRLRDLLMARPGIAGRRLDILDLGCGTGLVGEALRGLVQTLVGVDLAPRMLDEAARRGLYTRLREAELEKAIADEPDSAFDLVTASDVFPYLGRIDPVGAAVFRVLRPGGHFLFSVEALLDPAAGAAYRLNRSGRFSHALAYLRRVAAESGFVEVEARNGTLRNENGRPIASHDLLWQKPA